LFFFSSHLYHRDLHSFPTRRSSDLLAARNMRIAISLRLAASSLRSGFVFFISETVKGPREILHCFMVTTRLSSSFSDFRELVIRSEEHTSELQSLAYLVCRLLLEKK